MSSTLRMMRIAGYPHLSQHETDRIAASFTPELEQANKKFESCLCCKLSCPFWKCDSSVTIEKDDGEQIIMVKRPDKHFLYCFLLPIPPLWMCACCELFNSVVEDTWMHMRPCRYMVRMHSCQSLSFFYLDMNKVVVNMLVPILTALDKDGNKITYVHCLDGSARHASEDTVGILGMDFRNPSMKEISYSGSSRKVEEIVNDFLQDRRKELGVALVEPKVVAPVLQPVEQVQAVQMQPMHPSQSNVQQGSYPFQQQRVAMMTQPLPQTGEPPHMLHSEGLLPSYGQTPYTQEEKHTHNPYQTNEFDGGTVQYYSPAYQI